MTPEIIIALSIFVLAFVSFIINKIPSGLTAVIAALVMTATGIITPSEIVSSFGTDTVIRLPRASFSATQCLRPALRTPSANF